MEKLEWNKIPGQKQRRYIFLPLHKVYLRVLRIVVSSEAYKPLQRNKKNYLPGVYKQMLLLWRQKLDTDAKLDTDMELKVGKELDGEGRVII